jgi:hypothetical protein
MKIYLLISGLLLATVPAVIGQTVSAESNKIPVSVTSKPKGPRAALAYSNVTFLDANKNNTIEPQENTSLSFTIRNLGNAPSKPIFVKAYTSEEIRGLSFPAEKKYEPVVPGETRQIVIAITSGERLEPGTATVLIDIKEEYEYDADQIEINIVTDDYKKQ